MLPSTRIVSTVHGLGLNLFLKCSINMNRYFHTKFQTFTSMECKRVSFIFRENGADSILDLGLLDSSEKVQVRDFLFVCLSV